MSKLIELFIGRPWMKKWQRYDLFKKIKSLAETLSRHISLTVNIYMTIYRTEIVPCIKKHPHARKKRSISQNWRFWVFCFFWDPRWRPQFGVWVMSDYLRWKLRVRPFENRLQNENRARIDPNPKGQNFKTNSSFYAYTRGRVAAMFFAWISYNSMDMEFKQCPAFWYK